MHEVLVNRLGGLSLPRKSVVRLTDRPDMTLDVYRGRKTTVQQQQQHTIPGQPKLPNISKVKCNNDQSPNIRRLIQPCAVVVSILYFEPELVVTLSISDK